MNTAIRIVAAGWMLAATHALAAGAPSALSICLPSDDAPRADRESGTGLDIDVARVLARELGRPLELVWLPDLGEIDEVSDFNFRPLLTDACDAHLSIPGADALGRHGRALALSEPYYGTAYELIPETAGWRWGAPFDGTIAVMANSIAHVAVDAADLAWSMRPTTHDIAAAVASDEAQLGLVWGPDLGEISTARAPTFDPPPVLRWNQHAATRRDDPLLADLNRVFGEPGFRSQVARILGRHGVPQREPFVSVYSSEALRAIEPP